MSLRPLGPHVHFHNIWPRAHIDCEFICVRVCLCQVCYQELLQRCSRSSAGLWYHKVNQPSQSQTMISGSPSPLYNVTLLSPYAAVERPTTLWPRGWPTPGCWPVRTSSSSFVETRRTWMWTERSRSWRRHALLRRTVDYTVYNTVMLWSFLSKPPIITGELVPLSSRALQVLTYCCSWKDCFGI